MKGIEKAAVLLLAAGEDLAAEVLKHLRPQEIQKITASMVKLDQLKNNEMETVADDFVNVLQETSLMGMDGGQYMHDLLAKTLGQERAAEMMESYLLRGSEEGLEAIRVMEPRVIADILKREHPQVTAFILATLDPPKVSQVLSYLPEDLLGEVVYRVAVMENIHPNILVELEEAMKSQIAQNASGTVFNLGGVKFAAELINRLDSRLERTILDDLRNHDAPLCERIQQQLFVFEDIVNLNDRTLQIILKEISTEMLVLSLRATDEAVKEKFFQNMSERAAGIVKEEMELSGPVRLVDVEKAQLELIKVIKGLEEAGKITLPGKGADDQYV